MRSQILMINLPYNCTEGELRQWVEVRGIQARSVRLVHDDVARVSPAFGYVELQNDNEIKQVVEMLNGRKMRSQTIWVKEAPLRTLTRGWA
jgi:RNA recognition motif-containing protein